MITPGGQIQARARFRQRGAGFYPRRTIGPSCGPPHDWSTGTELTWWSVVRNRVVPALGDLRLRELSVGTVTRAIRSIADRHGPAAAESARRCLSGMFAFAFAIEDGAVPVNPVREHNFREIAATRLDEACFTHGRSPTSSAAPTRLSTPR